jgi:hypothetical protein
MRRSRTAGAAAAAVALFSVIAVHAHLEFGSYKTTQLALEVVSLLVVGDWGGQSADPYTTPGQLAAAAAMATVATASESTFVLSAGGNFYGDGIQGASRAWGGAHGAPGGMPKGGGKRAAGRPLARAAGRRLRRARRAAPRGGHSCAASARGGRGVRAGPPGAQLTRALSWPSAQSPFSRPARVCGQRNRADAPD